MREGGFYSDEEEKTILAGSGRLCIYRPLGLHHRLFRTAEGSAPRLYRPRNQLRRLCRPRIQLRGLCRPRNQLRRLLRNSAAGSDATVPQALTQQCGKIATVLRDRNCVASSVQRNCAVAPVNTVLLEDIPL